MKKFFALLLAVMLFAAIAILPVFAEMTPPQGEQVTEIALEAPETAVTVSEPDPAPFTPYTWEYLATIAGATAFTLLVAQFLKFPLDKVWRIPTRILVYIIALIVMLVASAFTGGLTVSTAGLAVANAFVVAFAAYGAYEVTFAKMNN